MRSTYSEYVNNVALACEALPEPLRFPAMALLVVVPISFLIAAAAAPFITALVLLTHKR